MLSVVFVAVHVATTVIDGFAPIGWLDAVIPFRSPYRPLWLGLGAVSTDLLIAMIGTSLLRGRLGYRAWRAVHWAAYACWPIALLHGMGTGTDIRLGWGTALNIACLVAVLGAVWWRLADAWGLSAGELHAGRLPTRRGAVVSATVASTIAPVAVIAWLVVGPLQPGWAKRAGTPTAHRSPAPASVATAATSAGQRRIISGRRSGRGLVPGLDFEHLSATKCTLVVRHIPADRQSEPEAGWRWTDDRDH